MARFSQKLEVAAAAVGRGALRAVHALTCGEAGGKSLFYAYKIRSEQLEKEAKALRIDDIFGYAKSIRMSVNAREYAPEKSAEAEALLANEMKMWLKLGRSAPGHQLEVLEKVPLNRFQLYFSRSATVREKIADAFQKKYCLVEGCLHTAVSTRVFSEVERLTLHERWRIDRFGVFIDRRGHDKHVEYVGWTNSDGGHWQTKPI